MRIKADLHIHSALSPCGSLEMSPKAIVDRAIAAGLDLIAVTDHNSMENAFYAAAVGKRRGLKVVYGMEAQTREDVHILCLFGKKKQAERFRTLIYDELPKVANNPDYFGDQAVVDEEENVVRFEERLLLNGLAISLAELVELVRSHEGFLIPSHVECPPFGLMPNLGFVPPELSSCVMEISFRSTAEEVLKSHPELAEFPLISNSDAHYLSEIGRVYTEYEAGSCGLGMLYGAAVKRSTVIRRER